MSHNNERKEKNCLNCNTEVHGLFCHVCGQPNIETKESFLTLAKDFVFDIIHFDGKFFHTLKYIFTKPGFVARQYAEGKRTSYLHPIRMYLFTSAVFFLILFSMDRMNTSSDNQTVKLSDKERIEVARALQKKGELAFRDSILQQKIIILSDTTQQVNIDSLGLADEALQVMSVNGGNYTSLREYDSVQASLSEKEKDGWITRAAVRQSIKIAKKYGTGSDGIKAFLESLGHKLPYLLFLSLPFFAMILKLLYIRRKNFYYSDHAIFTLYHYIFSFLLLLLIFCVRTLSSWLGWSVLNFIMALLFLLWPVYLYIQMKRFYRQSRLKTILKFLLLNLLGFIVIIMLLILFAILSIFQI